MPDREKVIKGLECCGTNRSCIGCPYVGELFDGCYGACILYLNRDALELLKEQEPMMVRLTASTVRCPKCGKQITSRGAIRGAIHREIKFCWKCGQAVKWDA